MAAIFNSLRVRRETSGEGCGIALVVEVHSRIVQKVGLGDQNLHPVIGGNRYRQEGEALLVPTGKRSDRVGVLERVPVLTLKGFQVLSHVRDIGAPVLREIEASLLRQHLAVFLQRADEAVGDTLVVGAENKREFLEYER